MSKKLKLFLLLIFATVLWGCTQKLWQITYDYRDNLYTAHSTQLVTKDAIYVLGFSGEDSSSGLETVFLTRFDLNGNPIWETVIPGMKGGSGRLATGKPLVVDADKNIVLAWTDMAANQIFVFKLNAQGLVVDSWSVESGTFVDDMMLSNEGVLYFTVDKGYRLFAYTTYGDLVWSDEPGFKAPIDGRAELSRLQDNKLLVSTDNGLAVYSLDGVKLADLSSVSAQVGVLSNAQVMNDRIWLATSNAGEGRLVGLDSDLQIVEEVDLELAGQAAYLAASGGKICVVTGPGDSDSLSGQAGVIRVHQIDEDGSLQNQADVVVGGYDRWYFLKNIAVSGSGCYFGENYDVTPSSDIKSAITLVKPDGTVAAPLILDDGVLVNFDVVGGDVIRSDMVGEYDNSYIAISLSRHGYN